MSQLSSANHDHSPPRIDIPRHYNAAHDLLARNAARAGKPAYIDAQGVTTYGELSDRAHRFANALRTAGYTPESRALLCLLDTVDFPVAFLGCILAGVVPIAVNTLLTTKDFDFMLRDSRAELLVVSQALLPAFAPLIGSVPTLRSVLVSGSDGGPHTTVSQWLQSASTTPQVAGTCSDDMCFWLYSSGSTGSPKGTVHLHSHLIQTAELYARPVLGLREDDVVFSAAKLFFAYGLGNALTFPMSVGATTVLLNERPTPAAVWATMRAHPVTVFCGVPTLYASLLADPAAPARDALAVRVCTSAGEALPADLGKRWTQRYGAEILDGIGSTEMLHIFLSNRPGEVRYGSTGRPVPGYQVRLVDEEGRDVPDGEMGELLVSGPTAALMYWNNRARTKATFCGEWTRSGDKYLRNDDGTYSYAGRTDDMLKVGGIYVSPFEVEAALATHAAVLEAAVIGAQDDDGLVKPKAYVVLKAGQSADAATLQQHVKAQLAPYKYPRWVEFVPELPKTATGKIQRFKLRQQTA